MLEHGGRLRQAARQCGIPLGDWLDLSTGLAPRPWTLPELPVSAWARLPEDDDGLAETAAACYGAPHALPVAGSQAAIQALPELRAACRVGILEPCYGEHAHAWGLAGHEVLRLPVEQLDAHVDRLDVLVLANPNNPSGQRFSIAQLLAWHARLNVRGGWLLVDEAFMDGTPERSLAAATGRRGLIVLRSFGKFFGLAGIRLGFVLAESVLLARLNERLGPWTVSGPARALVLHALGAGQAEARAAWAADLQAQGRRLESLLRRHRLPPEGGTPLFQWVRTEQAAQLHEALARRGILVRLFTQPVSLRFGLPPDEAGWQRLASALEELVP